MKSVQDPVVRAPPGVLVAKVGYFGVKSAKVLREQMAWAHQHAC